ncbi:hypothetical protein V2J09_014163 [Rumex salicifolius]
MKGGGGGGRSDSGLMKRLMEAVSMKTNQLRNRIMIFVLLHRDDSVLMDGMHAVLGGPRHRHLTSAAHDDVDHPDPIGDGAGSFIVYMNRESATVSQPSRPPHQVFAYTQEDSEGNYRDLTHDLLKNSEEDMEFTDNEDCLENACKNGRGSWEMNNMMEFDDDDDNDIDHAAEVFIERFKRQMRLKKLENSKLRGLLLYCTCQNAFRNANTNTNNTKQTTANYHNKVDIATFCLVHWPIDPDQLVLLQQLAVSSPKK